MFKKPKPSSKKRYQQKKGSDQLEPGSNFQFCRIPELLFFCTPRQSIPFERFRGGRATQKVVQTKTEVRTGSSMSAAGGQAPASAADILREVRDLKAKAEVGVALERAIETAKEHNKTNEGRCTWQTLLTAAAFRRPVNDDQEAEEEEEEIASMSSKRKAGALGVREGAWSYAVKRVKQLQADLHPREAIEKGVYWFWPRAQRSDATSENLMELMRQYWHDGRQGARPATQATETCGRNRNLPPLTATLGGSSPNLVGETRCTQSSSSGRTTGASSRNKGTTSSTLVAHCSSLRGASV